VQHSGGRRIEKLSAMSAAELRDLSEALLCYRQHTKSAHPAQYLPKSGYVRTPRNTLLGPVVWRDKRSALRALVDFSASAEVAMGNYQTADGIAALILIEYRHRNCAEHLRQIDAPSKPTRARKRSSMAIAGPIFDKRPVPSLRSPPARCRREKRALF